MAAELPWWEGQLLLPMLSGLLSGIAGSFLWEGSVKRHRDRRDLAHALATEIESLGEEAGHLERWLGANGGPKLPRRALLLTPVFDAVTSRIVELRPSEISEVLRFYGFVTTLRDDCIYAWEQSLTDDRAASASLFSSHREIRASGWAGLTTTSIIIHDMGPELARVLRARYDVSWMRPRSLVRPPAFPDWGGLLRDRDPETGEVVVKAEGSAASALEQPRSGSS
jgi:hypothetical protein